MYDTSDKFDTLRTARAQALVRVSKPTFDLVSSGRLPKGDPLPVLRVAGVMAAKRTADLIPYCHPISVDHVKVEMERTDRGYLITTEVKAIAKTGVEMEALTAAGVAALTLYDMLKPVDDAIVIESVRLLEKTGGKSDFSDRFDPALRAAVLVLSDSVHAGKKEDRAGKVILEELKAHPVKVEHYEILPDEPAQIADRLRRYADEEKLDMVLTTGGTGTGSRDQAVEAARPLLDRELPGVMEAARAHGQRRTPYAMLSRGVAGFRHGTLIVTLPGSTRGARESVQGLFPALLHVFRVSKASFQHDGSARKTRRKGKS
ncbi:MAG: bifunctional molybdenum cofactor biosynthesis protein MoaC/MoaB [Nitrospirae bacterium]|nr:bifunctional molybdenum cofactor biosynthesis protein MoaC/MoaB [Nitrospirota bacterium]